MVCGSCGPKMLTVEQMKNMTSEQIIAAYRQGYKLVQGKASQPQAMSQNQDLQHGEMIRSLAATCPVSTKGEGDTVILGCAPSGGTGPYTVTYYKKVGPAAETVFLTAHTVPEGGPDPAVVGTRTDTITDADIAGATGDPGATPPLTNATIRYRMSIADSCPTGALICEEYCDVTLTCVAPTCNFVVT